MWRRINTSTTRLIVQQIPGADHKENTNATLCWPRHSSVRWIHWRLLDFPQKEAVMPKAISWHDVVMLSSSIISHICKSRTEDNLYGQAGFIVNIATTWWSAKMFSKLKKIPCKGFGLVVYIGSSRTFTILLYIRELSFYTAAKYGKWLQVTSHYWQHCV